MTAHRTRAWRGLLAEIRAMHPLDRRALITRAIALGAAGIMIGFLLAVAAATL